MTINVTAGRITINDGSSTVLDSNDKTLHVLSEVSASFFLPALPAVPESSWIVRTDSFQVATVNPLATHLLGAFKFDWDTSASIPPNAPSGVWIQAGGTFVLMMKSYQAFNGAWSRQYASSGILCTFELANGAITYTEEIRLRDGKWRLTIAPGRTVTYRLFACAFA